MDGDLFIHFVEHSLLSLLQPFNGSNARSIVVMDNASVHHVDRVVSLITGAGAILRFLPPYSPDLQPLEEAFSKVKYFLKRNEVIYDSTSNLSLLVTLAFTTVTSKDCIGYIEHMLGIIYSIIYSFVDNLVDHNMTNQCKVCYQDSR